MDKMENITDTFPYILGNCLFRKNEDLHNLMDIQKEIGDKEYDKDLFPIFENLLLRREVFDMQTLHKLKGKLEIEEKEESKEEEVSATDRKLPIKMNFITHTKEYYEKNKNAIEAQKESDSITEEEPNIEEDSGCPEEDEEEKTETADQDQANSEEISPSDSNVEERRISEDGI